MEFTSCSEGHHVDHRSRCSGPLVPRCLSREVGGPGSKGPSALVAGRVNPDDGEVAVIRDPELRVELVEDRPGERRLVVTYVLDVVPDDPLVGATLREDVVVTARDMRDALVFPSELEVHLCGEIESAASGSSPRRLTTDVHRADLDVVQDWWRINAGGSFEAIAEFIDHLVAEIRLSIDDETVATATTPTITGSWGALGDD